MKRICVWYHMSIDHSQPADDLPHNIETAESCITISVLDEIAADLLENQEKSKWVRSMSGFCNVADFLYDLAVLQGYQTVNFLFAEPDEIKEGV